MLGSSTFGFKSSQLRGVLSSRIAEGLRVMALPWRQIQLVSWMRQPLRVVKLTVDGSSRGNMGWLLWGVFYKIIEVWFWLLLDHFLAVSRYFTLSSWLCMRGWSLLLNMIILCLRWSWIRLRLFLGSILEVLFVGIIHTL